MKSSRETLLQMAGMITRLLLHYGTTEMSPANRKREMEDWIDDVREFDLGTIEYACREWRRSQSRRPVPSDIRQLCIGRIAEVSAHKAIIDQRSARWPKWLEETWGPEPEGPRLRAEALRQDAARRHGGAELDEAVQRRIATGEHA